VRIFPVFSYTGVSLSDRRAVVGALREGISEVWCAFSSGPEREWTLDSLWIYRGYHRRVSRAGREIESMDAEFFLGAPRKEVMALW